MQPHDRFYFQKILHALFHVPEVKLINKIVRISSLMPILEVSEKH